MWYITRPTLPQNTWPETANIKTVLLCMQHVQAELGTVLNRYSLNPFSPKESFFILSTFTHSLYALHSGCGLYLCLSLCSRYRANRRYSTTVTQSLHYGRIVYTYSAPYSSSLSFFHWHSYSLYDIYVNTRSIFLCINLISMHACTTHARHARRSPGWNDYKRKISCFSPGWNFSSVSSNRAETFVI